MNSNFVGSRRQSEGLWSWNLVSDRFHFSPGWTRLVGCEEHEVGNTRQAWLQRVHPEDIDRVSRALDALLADGSDEFELQHRMLHKDGSYRWTSCRGVIQRNAGGQAVRVDASHSDVTADTVSDSLTGLPNRLLLVEHLTQSIERANRYPGFHFAVLRIGLGCPLDAESLGRATDLLLPAVARRLETSLRVREIPPTLRNHDLVARLQDDQFAILLDGLKEVGHATVAAERILAELQEPFTLGGREVRLLPSIGIAISATGYRQAEDVLRDADIALHRATLLGRSRCEVFDTAVLKSAQAELQLEADFEGALDRDEFLLLYQPIVSLTANQVVGFEALVRWQHPVLGLISPLEFIPIAERTGFIVPLGRWILREACLQLKAWQDSLALGAGVWMSVNLSGVQLRRPTLFDEIGEVLRESGLDARCLVLELTEGIALENPAAVRTLLMQLRATGVRISVDDFGTGYSSLAYLRQLPLDSIKVDRAFVRGIEANTDMVSILTAVTGMAHKLGLQVVVEGIENEEQLVLVRSLDCASGQGYLFSRPLDLDDIAARLKAGLPPWHAGGCGPDRVTAPAPDGSEETAEGGRNSRKMKWAYAAAAVLTVVASVGVPRYFRDGPPPVPPVSSSIPENTGSPVPTSRSADIELPAPATVAGPSISAAAVAPAVQRPKEGAQTAASKAASSAQPSTPPTLTPTPLHVIHQHRLGSCRGLLIVSRDGLAFVPDVREGDTDHAFRLGPAQFLHVLAGDTLTVRSHDKVYRFKVAFATGEGEDQLARLLGAISRLR
jgi:diguanylate cyclase (GGDEF)-like protein